MKSNLLALCVAFHAVLPAIAATPEAVSFTNDLIPVFTKHGCNAGACHGAAIGRGGFKLSLYGGDPSADYDAVVRQAGGRRVNLADAERSLIVLKPTEFIEHGGSTIFEESSESAELLLSWIQQGANDDMRRTLTHVNIAPRRRITRSTGEPVSLTATAHYSDGTSRDVTRWTIFKPEDSSAVEITESDSGQTARVLRRGRHIVVARYLSEVVPIELIVPLNESPPALAAATRRNFIDEEILDTLEVLGLPVSPEIDDTAFYRRATLDLTGRLPHAGDVRAILQTTDPSKQSELRGAMVGYLLDSPEFTDYWTLEFAKLLRIRTPRGRDGESASVYHAWLSDQLEDVVNYRELARTLLTSLGDTHEFGPPNFFRTVANAREQAEFMSELFMGSRLRCANCHNHPLDRWTQDDYHGLAAIFAKVDFDRVVKPKPRGEVIHPRTRQPAQQRIPGEYFLDGESGDGREQLANWLTESTNPYFAKSIVNRLWKRMMGRGLVEPVDDFRATNPATHPSLLDKLAEDFVANDYSLRHTLRRIASSAAYARSANATEGNKDDDRFYSHAIRRPLGPEVLADAISDVLGVDDKYGDQPMGTRAVALIDPKTPSRTLDVLGRCGREVSCESTPESAGGLPQKLHLFNGEMLNARIAAEGSRLQRLLAKGKDAADVISDFYLSALARLPTPAESRHWRNEIAQLRSTEEEAAFLEDFVWGLMTCEEFVTNH